ncbi:MAG TPA: MFS transporter, partial [Deltaproteobacteria bacterium]|nr:MFS transporter [Deltaproteobacteria bacterium]
MLGVLFSVRMLVALLMGFSCGLPLLLTITLLQAWMKEKGVNLHVIGMMALVGLPYTMKFLWAPLFDRFTLPFLGRRRGWLLLSQVALVASIAALALTDPGKSPLLVAVTAFIVTFFSASQDIVVDAYRREDLPDEELGLGSSLYVNGYRVGMLLASGGGLILADRISFPVVYGIMALCMLPGIVTTLTAREPEVEEVPPSSLKAAVIEPLLEYFNRRDA